MTEPAAPAAPSSPRPRAALIAVALGVWALLSFGHGVGLDLAYGFFQWAKVPGNLHADGGQAGMARAELYLSLFFGAVLAGVLGLIGYRLRDLKGVPRERVLDEVVPWALWATLVYLIWKCFIVYATELVHFGQYALVGFLVAYALGGRRPQLAFLITFGLGFLDEVWQHYGLHAWWMDDPNHWMDWSDPVLDGLGATGGILPFVTLARLRGDVPPGEHHLVRRALFVAALVLFPCYLLYVVDPVTSSWVLGHYIAYPFWGEYLNHKPTHWPNPREGIPLCLAALLVLGTILEPRQRALSQAGLGILAVLLALAIAPYSRLGGMPVHEVVPEVRVPWTDATITVDGRLDEAAWESAARVGPFVHTLDGSSDGLAATATHARLLWSERALYVAFECQDPDVWARDTHRDDPDLPADEVVEVFLDDGGDEVTYYEIEVSPKNVVYDLFNFIPQAPIDYNPSSPFMGLARWDGDIETAVAVDGSLDVTSGAASSPASESDRGWTVELAIPWENLRTTTTPSNRTIRPTVGPQAGDRWRLNLYRVERPRLPEAAFGGPDARLDAAATQAALGCAASELEELVTSGALAPLEPLPGEDGRRFAQPDARARAITASAQFQAWSPSHLPSFHRPHRFGVVTFVKDE